ncbi:hypothetical protein EYF80_018134 [Liparis tanakae]|uniref:Uncharacterized protein n=1 Tax=Liparis tanakae TaxID=230148 RepID=A0A4Z2I0H3_9TELE|nr:hypothetical protein EYF80_018134 [Liparis tanakae]
MDFLSDESRMSNSLWMRSSMAAFTGSQLTVMQSTFSWLREEEHTGSIVMWLHISQFLVRTLNLRCTASRRLKRSSALLNMVRKPDAFLSIMTPKISSSPWALTPLNWLGMEMNRFISRK